jgi:hypothetical protein
MENRNAMTDGLSLTRQNLVLSSGLAYEDPVSRECWANEFLFHTDLSLNPYVVFDIGRICYVASIDIENRPGHWTILQRAKAVQLHVSTDLVDWSAVELSADEGLARFAGGILRAIRYVRFSLKGFGVLHFKAVRVSGIREIGPSEDWALRLEYGLLRGKRLYITHESGFFSICSTALLELARSRYEIEAIDATFSFWHFKDTPFEDVWTRFFRPPTRALTKSGKNMGLFAEHLLHHSSYVDLEHSSVSELLHHYFSPSRAVEDRLEEFVKRYSIDCSQTIALCYRGTDKYVEVTPTPVEHYVAAVRKLVEQEPGLRILVQTDQEQIRRRLMAEFAGRAFFVKEMPVTDTSTVVHQVLNHGKLEFATNLLAVVQLMARCKHLVTHTGNVAYWTSLFRGHSGGLIQF